MWPEGEFSDLKAATLFMMGAVGENSFRNTTDDIHPRHLSQNTLCIHTKAPFLSNKSQ